MKKTLCLGILLTSLLVSGSATACTGFMSSDDQQVLLGNNEDWLYPEAYLMFYPAQTNRYARMYIKCIYPIPSNPEYLSCFAGINEHGLCYDVFLHPPLKPVNSSQKPTFPFLCRIIDYLEASEKIMIDKEGRIIWTGNPTMIKKIQKSGVKLR